MGDKDINRRKIPTQRVWSADSIEVLQDMVQQCTLVIMVERLLVV
jgi:hypothetical protein